MITWLRYFLSELRRHLLRQPLLALTTVTTVAMSLVLVGFFATTWWGADRLLERFAAEVHVTAYLDAAISETRAEALLAELGERPQISKVVLRSAEEDRARNLEHLPRDLVRDLPAEAVPGQACIDLVLAPRSRTRAGVREMVEAIRGLEGVDGVASVLSGGEKVQLAYAVVDAVRLFGLAVALLLVVGAIYFVFSTIRLSVHARKEEIAIRQLMGATRTFIRVPFYLEGAVSGGLGALVGVGIVAWLVERFNAYLRFSQLIRYEVDVLSPTLAIAFLAGGVLLGLMGSAFALGRYLGRHG